MKRKIFNSLLVAIMVIFSGLIALNFKISSKQTSVAASTSFEITDSASGYAEVSVNGSTVTHSASNFNDLLNVLKQNLTNADDTIEINFTDFTLNDDEAIILDSGSFVLSGTINSASQNNIIILNTASTLDATLSNLTINATNSLYQVCIHENSSPVNLTVDSCSFNSTAPDSLAINFKSTNHSFIIKGNNSSSATCFYNHIPGLTTNAPEELTNTTNLKILISYDSNNETILTKNTPLANFDKFEFAKALPFLNVEKKISNNNLKASVSVPVYFNINGGTLDDENSLPTSFIYNDSYSLNFLTSSELSKNHASFDGWFGKVNITDDQKNSLGLSTNTLYFDTLTLQEFVNSNYDFSKLKESLNDFTQENSFTSYLYDESKTNINSFYNMFAFLEIGIQPEFIVKWNYNTYTITFITDATTTPVAPISVKYGDPITTPANPEKEGYDFKGWFRESTFQNEYNFSSLTSNLTVYAKFEIKEITVTFVPENGESNTVITNFFNQPLELLTPEKLGSTFLGWFENGSDTEFTSNTMPANNVTLYAKWSEDVYTIVFITYCDSKIKAIEAKYNEPVAEPTEKPVREGYTFIEWTDYKGNTFVFNTMPLNGTIAYAKWRANRYSITLISNITYSPDPIIEDFGEEFTLPTPKNNDLFINPNHYFAGWFVDENFTIPFTATTMPASNPTIYACWKAKQSITIVEDTQNLTTNDNIYYLPNSDYSGFLVQYLINGSWSNTAPTEVGSYDVKISRNEDETFASFETIIKGGLVVTQALKNMTWLIILLFAIGFMEIVATVIVKVMHNMKSSPSVVIPFLGITLPISNNQFIWLIVSAVFALVCFVVMVYHIVKLIKAVPNFEQEIVDVNRNQIETIHQQESEKASSYERNSKYTAQDIENILESDTFEKNLRKRNTNYNPDARTDDPYIPHYETEDDLYDEVEYQDPDEEFEDEE